MKTIQLILLAALVVVIAGCSSSQKNSISGTVAVDGGLISGSYDEVTGITTFKGVPFAAPPVGDLRWKAPQPVVPWEGVKQCTTFSASPIQHTPMPFSMWTQEFIAPKEPLSEDCLYLNVWSEAKSADEKRPVFVYI